MEFNNFKSQINFFVAYFPCETSNTELYCIKYNVPPTFYSFSFLYNKYRNGIFLALKHQEPLSKSLSSLIDWTELSAENAFSPFGTRVAFCSHQLQFWKHSKRVVLFLLAACVIKTPIDSRNLQANFPTDATHNPSLLISIAAHFG